ncbi:MAG TPA: FG-GAP-like repeat-containing protein [Acidobacteriota bacterium]|nr:FG-GAP-like repeat-containing protein [Acidobacteriota bacterium]
MNRPKAFLMAVIAALLTVVLSLPVLSAGEPPKPLPEGVSEGWLATVQQGIQKEEYNISPAGDGKALYQAPNRAHGFRSRFTSNGIEIAPLSSEAKGWSLGLELVEKPEGLRLKAEVKTNDNRIEYDRGNITEWYVNDEKGLEQGFTVHKQAGGGGLHIDMKLTGNLRPKFSEDGQAVHFYSAGNNLTVLSCDHLKVTDSRGAVLSSRFEGINGGIRIAVDDREAVYPVTVDPLVAGPVLVGGQGRCSTAGDVNGDGYGDVIVGVYYYDNGETNEGAAFVYYGSASGLNTTPLILESNQEGAYFGESASTAGDVNGDGYGDIVVGALNYDNGETNEGAAFVYYGSASGLNTPPLILESNQEGALLGGSASTAGDVNGDGFSDVVVSAPYYHNGEINEGAAFVYYGSASGLNTTPLILESNQENAVLGVSVATAGDVNGDRFSDIVVGVYGYTNGQSYEGAAFVYYGSASGLNTTPLILESNQPDAQLGVSVATAGDVNGDGYSDIVAGARFYDNGETNEGAAFVYYGSVSGLSTTPNWTGEGNQANAYYGYSVSSAGDVNGDGYGDVVVGTPGYNSIAPDAGAVFAYYGSASGLGVSPFLLEGTLATEEYGTYLGTAGDVNGDGFSDILIASWIQTAVYYGGTSGPATAPGWTAVGALEEESLGVSVSSAGDVNGDGYGDVLVGAPYYDNGQADEGRALLFHGSATGLSTTPAWSGEGNQASALFGYSADSAGDVNGDGYGDVVVGAPAYDNGQTNEGAAFVYYGSVSGLSATPDWTGESNQATANYGNSVSSAGDVNGDGYGDLVVGAPYYDGGQTNEGRAFLYLGSASGLSATAGWTGESNQASAYFGNCVAGAGDVNRDGYGDVIITANAYDNGQTDEGAAFVYHGSPVTGLGASAAWTGESNQASAYFGTSASTAGDVNGDGYSDVIVGAPSFDNGQANEGRAFVYYGSTTGLPSAVSWYAESDQTNASYGCSVGTAGDVNNDGYCDVIVGARDYDNYNADEGRAYLYLGSASGVVPTAAWTADGGIEEASFGCSVATAGDVNGDGFSDIIVGASLFSEGEPYSGKAFLFYGNEGRGVSARPRQLRSEGSAPVAPLGSADDGLFNIAAVGRTPFGRGEVKLEWQVATLGGTFSTALNPLQTGLTWTDSGTSGASLSRSLLLADGNGPYIWRMRVKYNAATTPLQGHGPWLTLAANGHKETDIRRKAGSTTCVVPDEPCWIYLVTTDGTNHTINFQDPNQQNQRTGWNVRRSDDPSVTPKSSWPLVATNIVDMDQITGNYQWTDSSGDVPPSGTWYYLVTTYNDNCPAEGPFSTE